MGNSVHYEVVPLPQEITYQRGVAFYLSDKTVILYPEDNTLMRRNALFLADYIRETTGWQLVVEGTQVNGIRPINAIILMLNDHISQEEGYEIIVKSRTITVQGRTANGVFYGIQTLRKAIPRTVNADELAFPAVHIRDYPRFAYRGMMLDVCRHFFPVEFVKRFIDILALHNVNTFHWHLTDDQGWRIEIKKYPKLTEIGAVRKETVLGKNTQTYDGIPYGGYYTQEEIKTVIAYAQERYITIIPEIEIPGHSLAALAAYPELGCAGEGYEVATRWGIFKDVLCIGNEASIPFIEDVLSEVTDLFPSKYIHIGGDEAPRDHWKQCPKCQALIRAKGLQADEKHTAEDRLQSYCTQHVETFLKGKGRRIIGWDEILDGDIAEEATVMSWRGMTGGINAAKLGHDVIMTPRTHLYFDYYQSTDTEKEPLAIGGFSDVENVYSLEPVPAELTDEEKQHILGVQANLWAEYIPTVEHVEYMILPRLAALSEVQWLKAEKKNFDGFLTRLPALLSIYDLNGYNFRK
ncbi:MAG: beta-N-acetylhexosaminidase [Prevotellaceae bacterium]|nr:beta-N-acetylhexosaminidase [Prevotellaceae bacterium]